MAKNLKLKIKNTQLAKAAGLDKIKAKLAGEKKAPAKKKKPAAKPKAKKEAPEEVVEEKKPQRKVRARKKSAFAPKEEEIVEPVAQEEEVAAPVEVPVEEAPPAPEEKEPTPEPEKKEEAPKKKAAPKEQLGPTGKHIKDILPTKTTPPKPKATPAAEEKKTTRPAADARKGKKVRDFRDLKPAKRGGGDRGLGARQRRGLTTGEEERWRRSRHQKQARTVREEQIVRPSELSIRLPITVKDLAMQMKLKASELVQKLFMQGIILTLNDFLDDETTVQFLGNEFGCEIKIDTTEEERIQITAQTIAEEISAAGEKQLAIRPPVVAFMGHVDHGKTSLIDTIRKSNIVASESGEITQHIGAFRCKTAVGDLTILDTPGHEAFSAMRARGAEVTDIVVLVIAGDEGLRDQTTEAILHAQEAGVTIVVAINKCDKPNFNADNVYRELSEANLLPEAWGGQTITINTSAATGEGIPQLLEMLALQAEVLELRANPTMRARGSVLESELHKGMGCVATVLVQNGTLRHGDALVFEKNYGRVKTMQDEHGTRLSEAGPSTPVEITGLSGLPSAGDPFIVVESEKEARNIIQTREVGRETSALMQRKTPTLDLLMEKAPGQKKVLKLILRADMQGSVEALKASIQKIESEKAETDIIFTGVGEISESDVQLAAASNAVIIGFHSAVESHAEGLIKEHGVQVKLFDVIYHAIDEIKRIMTGMLDKIEEERDTGSAEVKAIFKSSQLGNIAGCLVLDGTITRNHLMRVMRGGELIWKGSIASLKRVKEDVKEIKKGFECGILLQGFDAFEEGDILQAYEIIYLTQEL